MNGSWKIERDDWLKKVTFDPVDRFDKLLERIAFLQLMNKRYVLYFRGKRTDYPNRHNLPHLDLPGFFRESTGNPLDEALLKKRWEELVKQSAYWREVLLMHHPRKATLKHFPESIWAVQQHYMEVLEKAIGNGFCAARTMFLDVSSSPRVAATFALPKINVKGLAFVTVIALPQTTGSLTYCAEEQLQLLRLSALCPPSALRPLLQEAFLVTRFPTMGIDELAEHVRNIQHLEEYYSLRRRIVAIIPIEINKGFWGDYGKMNCEQLLECPWFQSLNLQPHIDGFKVK